MSCRDPHTNFPLTFSHIGIGYCAVTVSYFTSFYYNTIMGWSLHFIIHSFSSPLPWTTCNNTWNTKDCFIPEQFNVTALVDEEDSSSLESSTSMESSAPFSPANTSLTFSRVRRPPNATSPASEYFRYVCLSPHLVS